MVLLATPASEDAKDYLEDTLLAPSLEAGLEEMLRACTAAAELKPRLCRSSVGAAYAPCRCLDAVDDSSRRGSEDAVRPAIGADEVHSSLRGCCGSCVGGEPAGHRFWPTLSTSARLPDG